MIYQTKTTPIQGARRINLRLIRWRKVSAWEPLLICRSHWEIAARSEWLTSTHDLI
jgi:hypothetical protein